jgi:hypothetical protein
METAGTGGWVIVVLTDVMPDVAGVLPEALPEVQPEELTGAFCGALPAESELQIPWDTRVAMTRGRTLPLRDGPACQQSDCQMTCANILRPETRRDFSQPKQMPTYRLAPAPSNRQRQQTTIRCGHGFTPRPHR